MFQYGLNTTVSMSSLKIGVLFPGFPTTTRMSMTALPYSRAIRWKYGMLTKRWRSPRSSGIQRQRCRLSATCWMRSSSGTFIAASVVVVDDAGGRDRVQLLERLDRSLEIRGPILIPDPRSLIPVSGVRSPGAAAAAHRRPWRTERSPSRLFPSGRSDRRALSAARRTPRAAAARDR